jgi:hypothetical protein
MRFFWRFFFSFQECLSACTSIAYKEALVDDRDPGPGDLDVDRVLPFR